MIESNVSRSCAWCALGSDGTNERLDESHSEHSLSPTGHLVVAVCLGFIGTFGFLNNTLVLVIFCRYKVLRSPMNCFLVSISVSDLLVCVLGTPFSFAASTQGRWLIGHAGCVWYGFANSFLGEYDFGCTCRRLILFNRTGAPGWSGMCHCTVLGRKACLNGLHQNIPNIVYCSSSLTYASSSVLSGYCDDKRKDVLL